MLRKQNLLKRALDSWFLFVAIVGIFAIIGAGFGAVAFKLQHPRSTVTAVFAYFPPINYGADSPDFKTLGSPYVSAAVRAVLRDRITSALSNADPDTRVIFENLGLRDDFPFRVKIVTAVPEKAKEELVKTARDLEEGNSYVGNLSSSYKNVLDKWLTTYKNYREKVNKNFGTRSVDSLRLSLYLNEKIYAIETLRKLPVGVKMITEPKVSKPVLPVLPLYLLIGAVLGASIGVGFTFVGSALSSKSVTRGRRG